MTHPAEMGAAEVEAFLTHLAVEKSVSASTQNQALAAILIIGTQETDDHNDLHSRLKSTPLRREKSG